MNTNTPPRLINLTNITFTKEHIHTLALGPNYALAKDPKDYINDLRHWKYHQTTRPQNTEHFQTHGVHKDKTNDNTLHKRHQYNLNQIKSILQKKT